MFFSVNQCTISLMTFQNKPVTKTCSRCGKGFQCQTHEAHGSYWCSLYPTLQNVNKEKDCMCSDCLAQATLFQSIEDKK